MSALITAELLVSIWIGPLDITEDDIERHRREILSKVYLQALVTGNIEPEVRIYYSIYTTKYWTTYSTIASGTLSSVQLEVRVATSLFTLHSQRDPFVLR